jgi:two-component system cell cycle sensor histidine kinase/response regulator CckA
MAVKRRPRRRAATRARIDQAVRSIVEGTASAVGEEFFHSLVRHLASAIEVRFSLLARRVKTGEERVETLSFWAGDCFHRNLEYPLAGTPCQDPERGRECFYPDGVHERFPDDEDLTGMGAVSYAGVPIRDSSGHVRGHLAVLDSKPMTDEGLIMPILRLFAARAGAEIERLDAEEALRESEERWRTTAENSDDFIVLVDPKGTVLFANQNQKDFTREQIIGMCGYDLPLPEYRPALKACLERVLATGEPGRCEVEYQGVDGVIQNFEVRAAPAKRGEEIVCLTVSCTDVTDRKRAEEALRQSERRFRELFDEAPVGYHEIDVDGRIVRVNRTELQILGYTAEEVVGRAPWEFFLEGQTSRESVRAKMEGRAPTGQPFERTVRRKDGGIVPVLIEDRLLRDDRGSVVGIRATMQDITDRKRAEEERRRLDERIQQAQKLEGLAVLAGGVAHDFNNLLVGILGNASLLLADLPPDSPLRESLELIEASARRAAELTNQMLAYAGKGTLTVHPVSLSKLVQGLTPLMQATVHKKVSLKLNCAEDLPTILADASHVQQLIMSLVTNASEAIGDEGGFVIVSTGLVRADRAYLSQAHVDEGLPEGAYVYLSVCDTGCGMDEVTKSRIFDPFFSTKFIGRGLGLPAVLGIVRGHRGCIRVDSEPGRGSTFTVLFPVGWETDQKATEGRDPAEPWRGSGTVLVVDDQEAVRNVARQMLERAGLTVLLASNGHQAIKTFRKHAGEIAIVLLDLTMPDMDGEEVFRSLRRIRPDAQVILSSGYGEDEIAPRLAGESPAGFLQKPYQAAELLAKVRRAMGG